MGYGDIGKLLTEFADVTGFGQIEPDEENIYSFEVDDLFTVRCCKGRGNEIVLYAAITDLPADSNSAHALLKKLMRFNLVWSKDNESVLTFDKQDNNVLLYRRVDYREITINDFTIIVEDFINDVETYQGSANDVQPSVPRFPGIFP